jgi:mannose-1-phosphate guanylyltransferase
MTIVPVILAGGVGERFWPLSRSARPKQLLPITTDRSMLEETLRRMMPLCGAGARPLIVTGCDMAAKIRAAIPKSLAYDVIAEPVGRDTAPAIAIAAAWICGTYGDAVMAIDTADHAIGRIADYRAAMKADARFSRDLF